MNNRPSLQSTYSEQLTYLHECPSFSTVYIFLRADLSASMLFLLYSLHILNSWPTCINALPSLQSTYSEKLTYLHECPSFSTVYIFLRDDLLAWMLFLLCSLLILNSWPTFMNAIARPSLKSTYSEQLTYLHECLSFSTVYIFWTAVLPAWMPVSLQSRYSEQLAYLHECLSFSTVYIFWTADLPAWMPVSLESTYSEQLNYLYECPSFSAVFFFWTADLSAWMPVLLYSLHILNSWPICMNACPTLQSSYSEHWPICMNACPTLQSTYSEQQLTYLHECFSFSTVYIFWTTADLPAWMLFLLYSLHILNSWPQLELESYLYTK